MQTINGKEIKGFSHADGVHWYWGDKEVAVINESRKEIEWCDRTFKFPENVINAIRKKIPETNVSQCTQRYSKPRVLVGDLKPLKS